MVTFPFSPDKYPREELARDFGAQITATIRELLQSKHLYQSLTVPHEELFQRYSLGVDPSRREVGAAYLRDFRRALWLPFGSGLEKVVRGAPDSESFVEFKSPDVKLFCQRCDRIEAFNAIRCLDILAQLDPSSGVFECYEEQVFAISFLCQSCKAVPEVFLVRRNDMKLTLSGRAPIEHVPVPPSIPKPVRHFWSGAMVAHQSGQTLAGNFLLRTLIEQWVRHANGKAEPHVDEAIKAYMESLPLDFKQRFPSLDRLYSDLSVDLHAAKGAPDVFGKASSEIEEHFDARRLFKLCNS